QVAWSINMVSVVASAFTVLLFYAISILLIKKIKKHRSPTTPAQNFIISMAAFSGSMAFAFTDSFWFNAAEAEVYALSGFFTALVFWATLKWEQQVLPQEENTWLIFISYLTGLAIGVHLLHLVVIPALALVVYVKKYNVGLKGCMLALLIGVA